jgi:CRISPR-associated protein (TIGR02584 family)
MPRRILLAATGLTPQIVTETMYGLATLPEPERFVPDELHVVTTQRGRELVNALFVQEHANQLEALCDQYGLPMPQVRVHVLRTRAGPLDDVRTAADNDAAADFILQIVRQLTGRDDTAVHFSIAGGRKTMGYYLGTCASLLGRPQDRMSHVLVNDPFESAPEFFFPPRQPTFMLLRGRPTDTARAQVQLANVGFIRLRPLLPAPLIDRGSFTRLVSVLDSIVGEPRLVLRLSTRGAGKDATRGEVEIGGGLHFTLQPKSFAMYWLLARQASRGEHWVRQEMAPDAMRRDFLEVYRKLSGMGRYDEEDRQFVSTPGVFLRSAYQNAMSRLTANLKKELGDAATRVYGPHKEGSGATLRHRLMLPAEAIRFESD